MPKGQGRRAIHRILKCRRSYEWIAPFYEFLGQDISWCGYASTCDDRKLLERLCFWSTQSIHEDLTLMFSLSRHYNIIIKNMVYEVNHLHSVFLKYICTPPPPVQPAHTDSDIYAWKTENTHFSSLPLSALNKHHLNWVFGLNWRWRAQCNVGLCAYMEGKNAAG